MESAPGGLGQLKLLADDYSDKSIDPEDIREDLKNELLAVHVALKKLDKDIDFSAIINPLIAEQGPAVQHIARLSKQIERLNKYREQFQRDKQESLKIGNDSREIPVKRERPHQRQKRQNMTIPAELIPTEVLPCWGILKRYSASMDKTTYLNVVYTAEWMFNCMLSHKEGPEACRMADLVSLAENIPQIPGGPQLQVKGYLTNEYLNFDNIKAAASAGDFRTVAVAYFRNEQLVAYRIENNPVRQRFIAWAVSHLHTLCRACFIRQQKLLKIYEGLPSCHVNSMGLPTKASVNDFFRNRGGCKLTVEQLRALAFPTAHAQYAQSSCNEPLQRNDTPESGDDPESPASGDEACAVALPAAVGHVGAGASGPAAAAAAASTNPSRRYCRSPSLATARVAVRTVGRGRAGGRAGGPKLGGSPPEGPAGAEEGWRRGRETACSSGTRGPAGQVRRGRGRRCGMGGGGTSLPPDAGGSSSVACRGSGRDQWPTRANGCKDSLSGARGRRARCRASAAPAARMGQHVPGALGRRVFQPRRQKQRRQKQAVRQGYVVQALAT